jgi:hypothetical protein
MYLLLDLTHSCHPHHRCLHPDLLSFAPPFLARKTDLLCSKKSRSDSGYCKYHFNIFPSGRIYCKKSLQRTQMIVLIRCLRRRDLRHRKKKLSPLLQSLSILPVLNHFGMNSLSMYSYTSSDNSTLRRDSIIVEWTVMNQVAFSLCRLCLVDFVSVFCVFISVSYQP